jgi:hypothetical protein
MKQVAKKAAEKHKKRVLPSFRYADVSLPGFEGFDCRPVTDRLREATKPIWAQVAPGKYAPYKASGKTQEHCFCFWHDNGDGTWSPIPINQRLLRLDGKLAKALGFQGQYNTIRRLGEAEMIELIPIAPHCYFINIDSWFNHLRRCAEIPEIWAKGSKYLKAYRSVLI